MQNTIFKINCYCLEDCNKNELIGLLFYTASSLKGSRFYYEGSLGGLAREITNKDLQH